MYPIVYGIFYLFSLLPLFVLYGIADFAFFILYYVLGYRTKVVMTNLETAFPEKTIEERKAIAREFYRNLTQTFVETLKMLSISGKAFDKMYSLDLSAVNNLIDHGKRIQVHSGHQMNWEMANLAFAKNAGSRWVAIYLRQKSEVMDKLLLRIRSRFGGTFISAQGFQNDFKKLTDSQYMLALIVDQNPSRPERSYWLNFFNRPAPFNAQPEKSAMRNKASVVFVNFVKVRRGKYRFEPVIITEDAGGLASGELTKLYRDFLENSIRQQPANYLWSHRRWKAEYDTSYSRRWIDEMPPPSPVTDQG